MVGAPGGRDHYVCGGGGVTIGSVRHRGLHFIMGTVGGHWKVLSTDLLCGVENFANPDQLRSCCSKPCRRGGRPN